MKNKKTKIARRIRTVTKIITFAITMISLFCFVKNSEAATLYMGPSETYTNLRAAMAAMQSGDTLIIRDGTYTGTDNTIDTWHYPPTSSMAWTTIKAENFGSVIFDGQSARELVHFEPASFTDCHWIFDGIVFKNSSSDCVFFGRSSYVKFLRCGFLDTVSSVQGDGFSSHTCSHILLEDCYVYGETRYGIHYYMTDNSIIRRCVVRHDRGNFVYQVGFQIYASENVEIQNCIVIDSDKSDYYLDTESSGPANQLYAFKVPQLSDGNINFHGCIALNNHMGLFGQQANAATLANIIGWDIDSESMGYGVYSRATTALSHLTLGNISLSGIHGDPVSETVTDSIIYGDGYGIRNTGGSISSDYNVLHGNTIDYGNVSAGTHDYCSLNSNAIDPIDGNPGNGMPALRYLPRIETGSDLDGAASDGGDIGATITKRIGVSGTLWGEEGYNTVTEENLWPFPNEDMIKEKMAAYSYDDPNDSLEPITGNRGFAASGNGLYGGPITLTSYIWEYLENPCPEDVCSYGDSGDTTAPVSPTGLDVQ